MSAKGLKLKVGKQTVELTQNHYKGAGGEATIYVKGGNAYKIYHEPKKMIPVGKIQELSQLKLSNVLAPIEAVYDMGNQPLGFVMPFVDKSEYLVRLFTKGFRDKNLISPNTINALVKRMQDTAKAIHSHKTLIVDANEMNFLVNKTFDEPYFIDTDSYQTPSYPATALMESVRDRKVKNNQFTELSDWFSLGCVFFQLYMGTHPYKGRHPSYGKDWLKMMDDGVSVFNKQTRLPPNVQDWSVIPKGHLRWFESIFERGERSIPPEPDQLAPLGAVKAQIIDSNDKFVLALIRQYDGDIKGIQSINGVTYAYTDKSIYGDSRAIQTHSILSGYTSNRNEYDFVLTQGDLPVIIEYNSLLSKLKYHSFDGKLDKEVNADGYFVANNRLYTVAMGGLTEVSFMNLGAKTIAANQTVANIFDNHKIFDGCVIQDMLGSCRIAIPYKAGAAKTIHIKELDKARIVDAKYQSGFAIIIAEYEGSYDRHVLVFDKTLDAYTIRTDKGVPIQDVNFTVMDKGVCVAENGDSIEIFLDNSQVKNVVNSPLNGCRVTSFGNKIYVINKHQLYQLTLK